MKRLASGVMPAILILILGCGDERVRVIPFTKPPLKPPILNTDSTQSYVEVEFSGIIAHVTSGNVSRAVLIRDANHLPQLTLPSAYKAAIEDVIKAECKEHKSYPQCSILLNNVALRIVSGGQVKLPPDPAFGLADSISDPSIPRLETMGVVEPLHDDVLDGFPDTTDGPVAAWFSLDGGTARPVPFKCKGNFPNQAPRSFNRYVTLSMFTREKAELQVKTTKAGDWQTVPLNASSVFLRVSNDPAPGHEKSPHFHLFGWLAKPPYTTLPNVIPEKDCTEGVGTVPGCSNSTWP